MKTIHKTKSQTGTRAGFTLLELLGVVAILSILVALILPAVMNAWARAEVTAVNAEFTSLAGAITKFKADYNKEPWSSINIHEAKADWDADPTSKSRIRDIWPQYSFKDQDLDGDGSVNGSWALTGSECLVFFLGGVRSSSGALIGFSKNPIAPLNGTGTNRTEPYPFPADRLIDEDGDGMYEYADQLSGAAIHYVSSNNGQGYSTVAGAPSFYVLSDGTTPWNKGGFQLISAGADGQMGFDLTDNAQTFEAGMEFPGAPAPGRLFERDNIANFHSGTLDDG